MKNTNKLVLAAAISHLVAFSAYAAVPHTFSSGEAALASEVNANFSDLDQRLTTLENGSSSGGDGTVSDPYTTVEIDCSSDATAFATAVEASRNTTTQTTYNITGSCDGAYIVRNDVKIVGTGGATIGPIAGDDWDGESLFIDGQSTVRVFDITLTGTVYARNSSAVRLQNVVLPVPAMDGDEYERNVDIRSSYLRINAGTVDNLSLLASRNSTVDIKGSVTGDGLMLIADANSTITLDSPDVSFEYIVAVGSSVIKGPLLSATEIISEGASYIEADELVVGEFLDIWGSARVAVWGDVTVENDTGDGISVYQNSSLVVDGSITTNIMECSNSSSFEVEGNITVESTLPWSDVWGLAVQRGCHGKFGNSDNGGTLTGGVLVDQFSSLHDADWMQVSTSE